MAKRLRDPAWCATSRGEALPRGKNGQRNWKEYLP